MFVELSDRQFVIFPGCSDGNARPNAAASALLRLWTQKY
jgi:hypothetical protein